MTQVALTDGTYEARSVIASAQRCVNLYPEVNQLNKTMYYPQQMTNTVITHYLTPGLTKLGSVGNGPIRGLYQASNGNVYCVSGKDVYFLHDDYGHTLLGSIGFLTTPVSMADNGTTLVLVDGTSSGYTINIQSNALASIVDTSFYGSARVDFIDTYFVFSKPKTAIVYSTTSNVVTPFDPLYFAAKTAKPDHMVAAVVMHDEMWLIGEQTTEVWYVSGGADFPFSKVPGAFIQHGCMAANSIAVQNLQVYWLSQNPQGERVVLCGEGYAVTRVSTHAIEADIAKYATASDAIGFIYQQEGHQFYVLIFPSADKTWVYDTQTDLWHERMYLKNGEEHRVRANCCVTWNGQNVVGDWENGNFYVLDPNAYTDDGQPIGRIRGFPTLQNETKRVSYTCFVADMEPAGSLDAGPVQPQYQLDGSGNPVLTFENGVEILTTEANDKIEAENFGILRDIVLNPEETGKYARYWPITNQTALNALPDGVPIGLRWSDTGGQSWSDVVYQTLGFAGEYQTNMQWTRLGMGRRRVFELSWSAPVKTALNGAYIDVVQAAE